MRACNALRACIARTYVRMYVCIYVCNDPLLSTSVDNLNMCHCSGSTS